MKPRTKQRKRIIKRRDKLKKIGTQQRKAIKSKAAFFGKLRKLGNNELYR